MLDEITTCSSLKLLVVFLLKLEMVAASRNRNSTNQSSNHLCYTCVEPLVGYTDHSDSCKYLNASSPVALTFAKSCNSAVHGQTHEFECRKVVVSYRSVETSIRRDCVPKGLCSWKDKTQSMIHTPVSDCVYTDERSQRLECIYCCDTPLCNRTASFRLTSSLLVILLMTFQWKFRQR